MKRIMLVFVMIIFGFVISSCGAEEIDACIGAASDPVTGDIDCDDCCRDNGYKRGLVSTTSAGSNSTRVCKCSGEED